MRAIGGDEVDDRSFVLQVAGEVGPALVRLQYDVLVAGSIELRTSFIQRRNAGIPPAGEIDGRQIERQAKQVVTQGAGDEFVNLDCPPDASCRG